MTDNKTTLVNFSAEALVAHKNNIKTGRYRFTDPNDSGCKCTLGIFDCSGIKFSVTQGTKTVVSKEAASEENLILSTAYNLTCRLRIPKNVSLLPTKKNSLDWPRSGEGRNFMEDVFLTQTNYFFDNLMYLSSKRNPDHGNLINVRPIGSQDIITIRFFIKGKCVAAQGSPLLGRILSNKPDDDLWPPNAHLTRMFSSVPIEHKLLTRSYTLLNVGFYQEAILVAFSVLDAKLQELIEKRIESELSLGKKETKEYLMNIATNRLDTFLNFLFKLLDKKSIKSEEEDLFKELKKINKKRNKIVHNGEEATRQEAANSIITIAKIMDHLNKNHKGDFKIPKELLSDHYLRSIGRGVRERCSL